MSRGQTLCTRRRGHSWRSGAPRWSRTSPLWSAAASVPPSGENARALTGPRLPARACSSWPVTGSQGRTGRETPAEARVRPSGENARAGTPASSLLMTRTGDRVGRLQRVMKPFSSAEATRCQSGANTVDDTWDRPRRTAKGSFKGVGPFDRSRGRTPLTAHQIQGPGRAPLRADLHEVPPAPLRLRPQRRRRSVRLHVPPGRPAIQLRQHLRAVGRQDLARAEATGGARSHVGSLWRMPERVYPTLSRWHSGCLCRPIPSDRRYLG